MSIKRVYDSNFKVTCEQAKQILEVLYKWYDNKKYDNKEYYVWEQYLLYEIYKIDVTKIDSIIDYFRYMGYTLYKKNEFCYGYQVFIEENNNIHEEECFEIFNKIAKYVNDGVYFSYVCFDGRRFKHIFENQKCVKQEIKQVEEVCKYDKKRSANRNSVFVR